MTNDERVNSFGRNESTIPVNMSRALASLTAQYTDSENEDDEKEPGQEATEEIVNHHLRLPHLETRPWSASNSPASVSHLMSAGESVRKENDSDGNDGRDFDKIVDEINYEEEEYELRSSSPISFHRSLLNNSPETIRIPSEPPGRCANSLTEKVNSYYEKMKEGRDMNALIQNRKSFRNPSIYEKLIAFCRIDELGTNYPPEIYDPHKWGPESYYEELAKRQKEEMDKKEKERRERTKVEFVTGTAKRTSDGSEARKKSKWDQASNSTGSITASGSSQILGSSNNTTGLSSNSKPAVISAYGAINKKK